MKTIGLIGGMSWESSAEYYRLINSLARERLGGHATPRSLMLTVNFAEIEALQHAGDWTRLGIEMAAAALQLQAGGADFIVLCTNTMHKIAPDIEAAITIPLLHIADAVGEAIRAQGIGRVGLLGTKFTMEEQFYRNHLHLRHGLEVDIPEMADRDFLHRAIYDELCLGLVREETKKHAYGIIGRLMGRGARAVILGCTELGLLLNDSESPVPLFDSTRLHAMAALDLALTQFPGGNRPMFHVKH
jgi:aspartate racemase